MNPRFFASPAGFRQWLETHHATATELWVGFYKKDSGRAGLTYAEAVDEALCFGWIDGIVKRVDAVSYMHRFTPRKPRSIWSQINLGHVERLKKSGRMTPAGLKVFAARDPKRSGVYSFENAARKLAPSDEKKFRAEKQTWAFFLDQPPSYRRIAIWWVVSAKKEITRQRRLAQLIQDSAQKQRLAQLTPKP